MSENTTTPFRLAVETPEPWLRVIKVEVPRSEYDRQYRQRLAAAVKSHQRPGFRKGKTPRPIVEKELGGRLRAETFEAIVPQAYRAAVVEHGLYPITEPALENLVFDDDKDLAFDLKVEIRPEVTAVDYENLPVEERAAEVTSAEVDQVLERLRDSRSFFEPVERAAAEGDEVVLDLAPRLEDGSLDEDKRLQEQKLIVGGEQNLPAFNEALLGAEAGQEREVEVEYPEEYPNEDMKGRTVTFVCQIASVRQKMVPEADDAFAAQLEEGQTLLELRGRIREGLEKEAEKRAAQDMDEQVLDQLIARNEVPVPPSMVSAWIQAGLQDMHKRSQQMGRPVSEDDEQQYREAARPVAERQIKGMFLLESVRQQEKLEVSEEEIEEKIAAVAAENGFELEKFREYLSQGEERDRILRGLEERKTYDFLLSRAAVTAAAADQELAEDGDQG
jgi:trigger factor